MATTKQKHVLVCTELTAMILREVNSIDSNFVRNCKFTLLVWKIAKSFSLFTPEKADGP